MKIVKYTRVDEVSYEFILHLEDSEMPDEESGDNPELTPEVKGEIVTIMGQPDFNTVDWRDPFTVIVTLQ